MFSEIGNAQQITYHTLPDNKIDTEEMHSSTETSSIDSKLSSIDESSEDEFGELSKRHQVDIEKEFAEIGLRHNSKL